MRSESECFHICTRDLGNVRNKPISIGSLALSRSETKSSSATPASARLGGELLIGVRTKAHALFSRYMAISALYEDLTEKKFQTFTSRTFAEYQTMHEVSRDRTCNSPRMTRNYTWTPWKFDAVQV